MPHISIINSYAYLPDAGKMQRHFHNGLFRPFWVGGEKQFKAKTAFTYGIHSCNTHYFAENAQMKQKCPDKDQKKKKNLTQQTIYSYSSSCQI